MKLVLIALLAINALADYKVVVIKDNVMLTNGKTITQTKLKDIDMIHQDNKGNCTLIINIFKYNLNKKSCDVLLKEYM